MISCYCWPNRASKGSLAGSIGPARPAIDWRQWKPGGKYLHVKFLIIFTKCEWPIGLTDCNTGLHSLAAPSGTAKDLLQLKAAYDLMWPRINQIPYNKEIHLTHPAGKEILAYFWQGNILISDSSIVCWSIEPAINIWLDQKASMWYHTQ